MHDKIIARRHNSYRLRAGTVVSVDQGKGPLLQAGIGPASMEKVDLRWDDEQAGSLVRRFPAEIRPGHRLYVLSVESGVSVHPDRPVFLFNAGNGHQHREVNAPQIRTRGQLFGDRLPLLLAAVVVGAFLSIYATYPGTFYRELGNGLAAVLAALVVAWGVFMVLDVRRNRARAERLEDEQSAAREAVDVMNADIRARLPRGADDRIDQESVDG